MTHDLELHTLGGETWWVFDLPRDSVPFAVTWGDRTFIRVNRPGHANQFDEVVPVAVVATRYEGRQ